MTKQAEKVNILMVNLIIEKNIIKKKKKNKKKNRNKMEWVKYQ